MKNKFNRILTASLASALLMSVTGCGKEEKILESSKEEQAVVMTIDGYDVPMELYRYVALNYKQQFEEGQSSDMWLGEEGQAKLAELNESVDKSLIKLYTTLSLCRDYEIDAESAFVKDSVNTSMSIIYETYENNYEAYVDYLRDYNMNDSVYRFFIRNDILSEELVESMIRKGEIPVDDETLGVIFTGDDFIRIKQILIPSDNGKTAEENYQTAEKIYKKVQAGEDFDTLIKEYGGDLFMFNNPDGYYMCKGTYHQAFEDAAFSLAVGETSDIIETDAGYSILKRYEKESAYIDNHFDDLAQSYIDSRYNLALEEREADLTVSYTDKLADYSIFNLSMTTED